jgi:hypothetical protein
MATWGSSAKGRPAVIESPVLERFSHAVMAGLAEGMVVEIDGLGTFYPHPATGFLFAPHTRPAIFIAYGTEDRDAASALYETFDRAGFSPWMDSKKLLPGQNWARALEAAIETSDFCVPCFSSRTVARRGGFQAEIRYALDCARGVPIEEIFLVPVRLDTCRVPRSIQRECQYVDLFPDWATGVAKVVAAIRAEWELRRDRRFLAR